MSDAPKTSPKAQVVFALRHCRRAITLLAMVWALLVVLPTVATAQEIDNSADVATGRALYMTHCATCHGLEAEGNGPMAPVLLVQPKSLAALSVENGGIFPLKRVVARIDGRDPLVSHGSAMPVYGEVFQGDDRAMKTETGQPMLAGGPIVDLVAYLRSIQQ
ncbi:Cytochrome c, mono-and diheme variants [Thalassovita autumnalis]|uniref:Cytochrome c, mono-and diheme variants n=1 Tax=Thalassovita autumnalis TaxID=2072972 RepID=A0A0P1FLM3_9RHOB|nr:cytochrome c [Thalassovita autumnalis]CUH69124.1 Cytochrome c, mono-and diheme variants [Thalassovita autumnalis]CUH73673.1 Cytochrome c, mono-and diheme variants [Thalassovita autumnalis]